jgi:uncharacterized protein YcfJ
MAFGVESNNTFSMRDAASDASSVLGIGAGLAKGGVGGDVSAAASAAKLAGAASGSSGLSAAGAGAGNVLGVYSGLQQGGVTGDTSAAVNAAQLGSRANAFGTASGAVGEAAGVAAIGLSLYNEINTWQSGATGSDAAAGAATGAAVGTMILPGFGTAIGAVVGAAAGALSSVFGGGKVDAENVPFEKYTQAYNSLSSNPKAQAVLGSQVKNPYLPLAGYFDLRSDQLKGSNPIYAKYGRMGEQKFTTDMTTQINQALAAGTISKSDSAATVYNKVVAPWVSGMGNWQDANKGAIQGLMQQMTAQYVSGQAQSQWKAVGGDTPFQSLPAYGALGTGPNPTEKIFKPAMAPFNAAVLNFPGVGSSSSLLTGSSSSGSMLPLILAGVGTLAGSAQAGLNASTQLGNVDPGSTSSSSSSASSSGDSSFLSSLGSFLSSPAGNLAEFGTLAGLGESQAASQKSENQQLAGSIATLGQPYSQQGAAELSQLNGGPQMGGPMGQGVADQTAAATNLGQVAKQYSTGQLTPAQQQQQQDYIKQQRAMVDSQLAASGNTDGSARDAAYQQIDNNAANMTQSLTAGNLNISEQALTTVQQTYNGLLNQALTSSEFGLGAQTTAVTTLIQGDTQLSQSLNSLFSGLAQGFGTAIGGGAAGKQAGTGNAAGVAGQGLAGVASSVAGGAASAIRNAGGVDTSAISDSVQGQENQVSAGLDSSTYLQEQSNATDISTQLDQSMYQTPDINVNFGGDPFGS